MKKQLLILATALFGIFGAVAQDQGEIEIGFNVGFTTSNQRFNSTSGEAKAGLYVAPAAEYYLSDRFGIKAKLAYYGKGWKEDYIDFDGVDSETKINLNYITVPVMINWHIGRNRNWYINAGPYLGFLISAKEDATDTDVKDFYSGTDVGLAYGFGYKYYVTNKTKIFLEYEAHYGFSNILEDGVMDEYGSAEITNTSGAFIIGVLFTLD